jgi:hypothetical protein
MIFQRLNINLSKNKNIFCFLLLIVLIFLNKKISSQVSCEYDPAKTSCFAYPDSYILDIPDANATKEFIFDSFSKYKGGITISGSTILRLVVKDNPTDGGTCSWRLKVYVTNNGAPSDEWETKTTYGSGNGTQKPLINMLRVRIDNGCHTPQNAGVWQFFPDLDQDGEDVLDIINPPTTPRNNNIGSVDCGGASGYQTNAVGSYLGPDYNEFTFIIDYKITPDVGLGSDFIPGRYQVDLKFCLTER